jgi:hypothetical protein
MALHVLALFLHTFFIAFFQVCRCLYFVNPTDRNDYIWTWSRLGMYCSGSISEFIVIYLFLQFSRPVSLKAYVKEDDDSDYEEEFDRVRDPNADMMFYVKNMPKMKKKEKEDYDVSRELKEEEFDDDFEVEDALEALNEDAKIDGFVDRMSSLWGEEETKLRMAVFVAFVNNHDTLQFRKKAKTARKSVVRST